MHNAYIAFAFGVVLVILAPALVAGVGVLAAVIIAAVVAIILFGAPFAKDLIKARHLGAKSGVNARDLMAGQGDHRQHDPSQEDR